MTANIDMSNDRANLAYTGVIPWHGLGQPVHVDAPIEEWRVAAGLTWSAVTKPVGVPAFGIEEVPGYYAVVRDDTKHVLGVLSERYSPVQPSEIVDFLARSRDEVGLKLEVLGALNKGAIIWGLLKAPRPSTIYDKKDPVERYYLISTSFDGSLPTTARETAVRVVCQNTLTVALGSSKLLVEKRHVGQVDWQRAFEILKSTVEEQDAWNSFNAAIQKMMQKKIDDSAREKFFAKALNIDLSQKISTRTKNTLEQLNDHAANSPGADAATAKNTVWGALNAVTYYVDHARGRNNNNRLYGQFWGAGGKIKSRAYEMAIKLAA